MTTNAPNVPIKTILKINAESAYPMCIYQDHGSIDRYGYLTNLAEEHGVEFSTLQTLLKIIPPNEDFDGLVSELEDIAALQ